MLAMKIDTSTVPIVGGGLAGSEAAWQAAERGVQVLLYEMRPDKMTPAHVSDRLAELVCSNSLGSDLPDRAAGLLKTELRYLGSLVLACADETRVLAGGAHALHHASSDREDVLVEHRGHDRRVVPGPVDEYATEVSRIARQRHKVDGVGRDQGSEWFRRS